MTMKHTYSLYILLALLLASCSPIRHAVHVEMRYPSKSGVELAGKIVSVVYVSEGDSIADIFNTSLVSGFAKELEDDYGTGEGSVGIYSIEDKGGNYAAKDTLVNLLMDTGSDAVFLLDKVERTPVNDEMAKFTIKLYCFDAMNKAENVYTFGGSTILSVNNAKLAEEAFKSGQTVAGSFKSQWKHEQYSITYYDSEKWYQAMFKAEAYDWKGAMDIWMELIHSIDPMKRACAEYNIAVACYMMGDYDLASDWLDMSDKENKLTLSDALRKRIELRK